jgi:hypothetical protein
MYILLTFWALLAVFSCLLRSDRFGCWYCISINQVRSGMRWAAAAAVPALVLVWLVCCVLGYGALWDTFFPAWFSDGANAAGNLVCDYLLDNLFWEVR